MVRWNDPATTRWLAQRVTRVEAPLKVTGRATYTADVQLERMLHAAVLGSPHAAATVVRVDTSVAAGMPGVRAVHVVAGAGTRIRYAGQELVAIAATTRDRAEDAVAAVRVEYDVAEHRVTTEAARADEERRGDPDELEEGDVTAALASSAARVAATYHVPVRLHACLETHGAVARWEGDALTVWLSTQAVHGSRQAIAANQDVSAGDVRVVCEHMGGGFGSKLSPGTAPAMAAALARKAGAPVRLLMPRPLDFLVTGNGPDATATVVAGATADGVLTGVQAVCYGTRGWSKRWSMPFPYVYTTRAKRIAQYGVQTNAGSDAPLRAPMHPQACAITESMMDELAYAVGVDPLAFRTRNQASEVRRAQLARGAELIGWARRNVPPGAGAGRWRRGIGVGVSMWGGGGGAGSRVELVIHPDASVEVKLGTQDLGTGTRTYLATIVAEDLGLPLSRVRPLLGDSRYGTSGASGGSTTTASVAPAVKMAALDARAALLRRVAPLLGARPDELTLADERVFLAADPTRGLGFVEACAKLGAGGVVAAGAFEESLQEGGVAGAQFAEVEVDLWTGRVRPLRIVAVHDCGYVVNPLTAESQIIGGVVQGIGMALLEERKLDEATGRAVNAHMEGYKLPGTFEIPDIVPVLFRTHERVAGIGEPPVIPTAAAIANAVFDAIGVRVRTFPLTPRRVLEALG